MNAHPKAPTGGASPTTAVKMAWTVTGVCCFYYLFLITNGDFSLFEPEVLGNVFDRMAWNLLHWQFTIEPEIIGREAFIWKGQTYAYFAIFPALLRVPLVVLYGAEIPNMSRISCWIALFIAAVGSVSIILRVHGSLPRSREQDRLMYVILVATLLTQPMLSITFTAWIYNEPIVWGTAFSILFLNLLLVQVGSPDPSTRLRWFAMGALAGLTFSVRPPPALAMTLALAIAILLFAIVPPASSIPRLSGRTGRFLHAAVYGGLGFLPTVAIALLVNWERWGDPTIFAPLNANIQVLEDAHRLHIATTQGVFTLARIPLGICYYFFGMISDRWTAAQADRLVDSLGWPRSALVLTSSTQLVLGLVGIVCMRRDRLPASLRHVAALNLLTVPVALAGMLLMLIYMNYRYRFEFLPVLVASSLIGAVAFANFRPSSARAFSWALIVLVGLNVMGSHLDLLQAKLASFAQGEATKERIIKYTWPASRLFVSPRPSN